RLQRAITIPGNALGRPSQQSGKRVARYARTRLKLGRHRAGTQYGDAHAARLELLIERLAEREDVGFRRIIDRHSGTRQEGGDRGHVENAALAAFQAVDEREGERGERTNIDVDHGELLSAVELVGDPEQAEAGIVDDDLGLQPEPGQCLANITHGVDPRHIGAQNRRARSPLGGNGIGKRVERLLASRDENDFVTVRGKLMGKRGPDAGRSARDHGDGTLVQSHGDADPRWLATRWPSSIRSREEMPRRSAARQIRLLSNSLTRPSAYTISHIISTTRRRPSSSSERLIRLVK